MYQLTQYYIEKQFISEQFELLKAKHLLQQGFVDVTNRIETEREQFSGSISYEEGEIKFHVKKEQDGTRTVLLESKTNTNKTKRMIFRYYENGTVLPIREG